MIGASVPPAIMTSASPRSMRWNAAPIEWAPEAHAVAVAVFDPRRFSMIERLPAAALTISLGTVKGLTFLGPWSSSFANCSSMVITPPIPEPIATPRSYRIALGESSPLCRAASARRTAPSRSCDPCAWLHLDRPRPRSHRRGP